MHYLSMSVRVSAWKLQRAFEMLLPFYIVDDNFVRGNSSNMMVIGTV